MKKLQVNSIKKDEIIATQEEKKKVLMFESNEKLNVL